MQLSVVVPFYNVDAFAGQTLLSLQRNAAAGVEFVLVDDASTDQTPALLDEAANRLPNAQVIRHPVNRGLAAARNTGLAASSGTYLAFLDGDDFVAAGYYASLVERFAALKCDFLRTDHVQVRGRQRKVARICHSPRNVVVRPRDAILPLSRPTSVDAPYAWAGIYHRRLADAGWLEFDERLRTCEDRPWNWRLHLRANSFAVVGLSGVFYRRNIATSLSQVGDERQLDFLVAFDQILDEVAADRDAELLLPKAVRAYCAMIVHHLRWSSRLPPDVARKLPGLCRAGLRRVPEEVLEPLLPGLGPDRELAIRDLLAVA